MLTLRAAQVLEFKFSLALSRIDHCANRIGGISSQVLKYDLLTKTWVKLRTKQLMPLFSLLKVRAQSLKCCIISKIPSFLEWWRLCMESLLFRLREQEHFSLLLPARSLSGSRGQLEVNLAQCTFFLKSKLSPYEFLFHDFQGLQRNETQMHVCRENYFIAQLYINWASFACFRGAKCTKGVLEIYLLNLSISVAFYLIFISVYVHNERKLSEIIKKDDSQDMTIATRFGLQEF